MPGRSLLRHIPAQEIAARKEPFVWSTEAALHVLASYYDQQERLDEFRHSRWMALGQLLGLGPETRLISTAAFFPDAPPPSVFTELGRRGGSYRK